MNQVIQGDCLEVMRGMADCSVDAVVSGKRPVLYGFQPFSRYNKKTGRRLQHPRNGNLVSVGHMSILQDFVDRDCPVCGATYQASLGRLKHGRQTTCSRKCSYHLRASQKSKGKVKIQCPVCLNDFERLASMNKDSQAYYCSPNCAYTGRRLGITKMPKRGRGTYNIKVSQAKPVSLSCMECSSTFITTPSKALRSKFCSRACFSQNQKKTMVGDLNPSWIDGRSYDKRCHRGQDWESQRKAAYRRDNYTCQQCGVKCVGRKGVTKKNANRLIQCHHIVSWKETQDNSLSNLITLCASCHSKIHAGKITLEQRVAWLETQTQALGAKVKRLEASQQLSLWNTV